MTANPREEGGDFNIYVVRKKDQKELMAKAKGGDETAKLVMWAASRFMKAMPNEFSACGLL
jgi:hypothetical protein